MAQAFGGTCEQECYLSYDENVDNAFIKTQPHGRENSTNQRSGNSIPHGTQIQTTLLLYTIKTS